MEKKKIKHLDFFAKQASQVIVKFQGDFLYDLKIVQTRGYF